MEKRYVKYKDSLKFEKGGFVSKLLSKMLPCANTKSVKLYERVEKWFLEIDSKSHSVTREIGLSADGELIIIGPFQSSRGLWTDSNIRINPDDFESLTAYEFAKCWAEAESKLKSLV